MTVLYPYSGAGTGATAIAPGANGFPGNVGTGFYQFGGTYACNFYAKETAGTNATLTTVDGLGHQTPYSILASTPFQIEGISASGFKLTGNGSSVILVVSATTPQGPAENYNPSLFNNIQQAILSSSGATNVVSLASISTGGTTLYTCPAGYTATLYRLEFSSGNDTTHIYCFIEVGGLSTFQDVIAFNQLIATAYGAAYQLTIGQGPSNDLTMVPTKLLPGDTIYAVPSATGVTGNVELLQEPL